MTFHVPRLRREVWWPPVDERETPGRLVSFVLTAMAAGAVTGIVARFFAICLMQVGQGRGLLLNWAHRHGVVSELGFVVVMAGGAAAASALVRRIEPHAEGSGIPRVEGIVEGRIKPGNPRILPIKFVGGLLSIGAGLMLGREGPSVQMGASIASTIGRIGRRNRHDVRLLIAAGAGAGLATAFNAPIAGGVFVLEELLRRFDVRASVATLLASGTGFATSQMLFGATGSMFDFAEVPPPRAHEIPWVLAIGLVCGLTAVGYNITLISAVRAADRSRVPREARAALLGVVMGIIALRYPRLVGGGDDLTQRALRGEAGTLLIVLLVLGMRFVFSIASYTAATPGGIFAPMLVLGTWTGTAAALALRLLAPAYAPPLAVAALIGMAAFFTASVQAPVTGMVLAAELTATTAFLPPMLGACGLALIVALTMRSHPVYQALTLRAARANRINRQISAGRKRRGRDNEG